MSKGGPRNRSGPSADPKSRTSERKGYTLTALPSEGFDGEVPEFPLPKPSIREVEIWDDAWTTPQACAWSLEPWRWQTVAEYARFKSQCEVEPNASLIAQLHRYRDQIGLTPAGLKENAWAIAQDQIATKTAERSEGTEQPKRERRLRSVEGAQ